MKRYVRMLGIVGAVLLLAGSANAAPTTTITSPADGASVSRSENPSLDLAGSVAFDTPLATSRDVFLRYSGDASTCGQRYISDVDGADGGNGCSVVASPPIVPQQVEGTFASNYGDTGEIAYPLTIDASRNITGTIAVASVTPNALSFDVRVTLGSQTLTETVTPPPYVGSWIIDAPIEVPVNIDVPAALDKVDVSAISVSIVWKQWVNVGASTWIEHDAPASFLRLPTYSASFDRKVEARVGSGAWTAATLNGDLTGWTASAATPAIGSYFVQARAIQGGKVGATAQNTVHVTA